MLRNRRRVKLVVTMLVLSPAGYAAGAQVQPKRVIKSESDEPPICALARSARARNSPAVPSLEAQCRAAGGSPDAPPPSQASPLKIANPKPVGLAKIVNAGETFQMICRGGPSVHVSEEAKYWPGGLENAIMSWHLAVDFAPSAQPPDPAGSHLQPGSCSPTDFWLQDGDPTQIQQEAPDVGDIKGWDTAPHAPVKFVGASGWSVKDFSEYLSDPSHYWRFSITDSGKGYFAEEDGAYWKPDLYKGRPPAPLSAKKPTRPFPIKR